MQPAVTGPSAKLYFTSECGRDATLTKHPSMGKDVLARRELVWTYGRLR